MSELLRPQDGKALAGPVCGSCKHNRGSHFNNGQYKGCDSGILPFNKPGNYCSCPGFTYESNYFVRLAKRARAMREAENDDVLVDF